MTGNASGKIPWLVRAHHLMRTAAFAMLFVVAGLHVADRGYGPLPWLSMALLLLAYPHIQFWRAAGSADPIRTEMGSLRIDAVLLGIFIAAIGFPLWIAFSVATGTLMNGAANKGWHGVVEAALGLVGGATLSVLIGGFAFSPATGWPATLMSMGGLCGYLLVMGNILFSRNLQLRLAREQLRQRQQDLLIVNETLLANIDQIDKLQRKLHEQANRDALTGLYNRRYLDGTLERELARCRRDGQSLSLIMADIDRFKKINDTYGHQAGDEILIRLGTILGGMARTGDVACRYGGEEFLLLMPTMSLDIAVQRAEELRHTFGGLAVPFGDVHLQTTLSIGVSAYPGHGATVDDLVRNADRALYKAKRDGRNRVEVGDVAAAHA